jgi:hypothetical protein
MAKLIYELNQPLDGYVDHQKFRPGPALFRHFIERVRSLKRRLRTRTSSTIRYFLIVHNFPKLHRQSVSLLPQKRQDILQDIGGLDRKIRKRFRELSLYR